MAEHDPPQHRTLSAIVEEIKRLPDDVVAIPHHRNPRNSEIWARIHAQAGHPALTPGDIATLCFLLPESSLTGERLEFALDLVRDWNGHEAAARGVRLVVTVKMTRLEHGWSVRETRRTVRTRSRDLCSLVGARTAPRARGAGRPKGAGQRSSALSGDSGDDDPHESEPPGESAGRRFCRGCGKDISHKRKDATTCGPKCRQRKHRHVDPLNESVDADPYLELSYWERETLAARAAEGCRCNGHHVLDPVDGTCFKCGHPRNWARWRGTAHVRLIQAASAERSHPRPLDEAIV